jgi:KRAB domain-containing zinc finger protein
MHKKTHENKVRCEICSLDVQRLYLKTHIEKHKEITGFKCDICGICYSGKTRLVYHMKKHQTTRKFKCEICKEGFNKPEYYNEHLFSHSADPRPFKCDKCGKDYCSRRALSYHITQTHVPGRKKKSFDCSQCIRKFNSATFLKEHLFAHSDNPRPFKCTICDNTYTSKRTRQAHMKSVHKS